ncbi:MAG TPA: 3-phosphoshikimate 1-carboxyvinyltransferase [Pirellulales bacterium]|jgi:3-phosphoshikimate 1-carboxyvinyltransferase|nr:3-phosphoshikimate 1-carboxyvinyltransferase [Pirellulales bacterium]
MMDVIEIQPVSRPLDATIRPPGSKSLTNRALIAAALADGLSELRGALDSEDTRVMIDGLRRLGIAIIHDAAQQTIRVSGCSGRLPATSADLFAANSGTTIRFLTALVAVGRGTYRLDGSARMRERPIEDLLSALRQLGVDARSANDSGCPPVIVHAAGLGGGKAKMRGDISSQFLSGLLLAAPYAEAAVDLEIEGTLVSQPYIRMTLAVMRSFGIDASGDDLSQFHIPLGRYRGRICEIEPDASAASYFFAAAAITGGRVTVLGLSRDSLQGDVAFCDCLAEMGCGVEFRSEGITTVGSRLRGIDVDMNTISDTVQTLAAVALFAEGPTTIRNVAHIRHKETDRIGNLAVELRKLGAEVEERSDGLRIVPRPLRGAEISTYNDHRMAMSLALAGLRVPGIIIQDPRCTEKTYPNFFRDLTTLAVGKP